MSRVAIVVGLLVAACGRTPRTGSGGGSDAAHATSSDMDPNPNQPPVSDKRAAIHLATPSGDVVVSSEVVSTPATIQRGLMYRSHLPPDDGMLFLMGFEDDHTFWMHNTLIPLDMIFIGADMKVAGVAANAEPRTDTHRSVGKPSLYVLEVNGGWAAAHGVGPGTVVRFEGVDTAAH
jgi:uncharacterized membrane protein (UPF0127 family)